jgi:transmembrane sensor
MAFVDRGTGVMKKRAIAPSDIGAWRSGQLFVQDETIGSVVEQLQRYHSAWISVPDSYLATQRVTGLYDLRDPDRALRALVQPYAGHVRDVSPYLRVISRL